MPKKSSASRFRIRTDLGEEPVPKAGTPGVALTKALDYAVAKDIRSGVWDVLEWEDVIFRVHRLDVPGGKLDVRVETLRA